MAKTVFTLQVSPRFYHEGVRPLLSKKEHEENVYIVESSQIIVIGFEAEEDAKALSEILWRSYNRLIGVQKEVLP